MTALFTYPGIAKTDALALEFLPGFHPPSVQCTFESYYRIILFHLCAHAHAFYSSSVKPPTKGVLDMVDVHCWVYHSQEEQDV